MDDLNKGAKKIGAATYKIIESVVRKSHVHSVKELSVSKIAFHTEIADILYEMPFGLAGHIHGALLAASLPRGKRDIVN